MAQHILEKVRRLNWLLQESTTGTLSYDELSEVLSDLMDSNVYITDKTGKILGVAYKIQEDSTVISDPETGDSILPVQTNKELLKITDTKANVIGDIAVGIFKEERGTKNKLHTIVPVLGGKERVGTLILARYDEEFSEEDLVLSEYGATVVGLEIRRQMTIIKQEEERKLQNVRMAIKTLSYSELEAVQQIFKELDGMEGLLVASKIADRSGITRSVIVNALRKLESAGVIESRSLGMKGTFLRVMNDKLLDEVKNAKSF